MNTVRAARVETRKLKQTHLCSHTMTDVVVVLVVCVREEEGATETLNETLQTHSYFLSHNLCLI